MLNLVKKMDHKRFTCSLAYLSPHLNNEMANEFWKEGIRLYFTPKTKNIDFNLMKRLSAIVSENKIQVINAHHFLSLIYSFYSMKKNKKTRLIYTEHSKWEVERIPFKWQILGSYVLNRIDGIIAVSEDVAVALRHKLFLKKTKISTIENGVDLERFAGNYNKDIIRKQLDIGADEMVIGMVANFRKIKNHIFLLNVFSHLLKEGIRAKLMLVGKGFRNDPKNSEKEINEFIATNSLEKHVILMGHRTDIPELLSIMDIFCLTSLNEGLPISLIEAMATGLPVVGTNVEGIRDVIQPGQNGFLVEPSDAMGLKKALETLFSDRQARTKFGENSRKFAHESYSLQYCVDRYQDYFEHTLTKRTPQSHK